jgi:hypothetical protein
MVVAEPTKIDRFIQQYNHHTRLFVGTATVDSILEKIKRLCQAILRHDTRGGHR